MIELMEVVMFSLPGIVGSSWRSIKGYQQHLAKRSYEAWDWWRFFLSWTTPIAIGLIASIFYDRPQEFMFYVLLFLSGIGINSMVSKIK